MMKSRYNITSIEYSGDLVHLNSPVDVKRPVIAIFEYDLEEFDLKTIQWFMEHRDHIFHSKVAFMLIEMLTHKLVEPTRYWTDYHFENPMSFDK